MVVQRDSRQQAVLSLLKERYEGQGYDFFIYPSPSLVPAFLDEYQPDAIAVGQDGGVVIEVQSRKSSIPGAVGRVAERFKNHDKWKYLVVFSEDFDGNVAMLGLSTPMQVEQQVKEVERLLAGGHSRAAFLLGWSVLEAASRIVESDAAQRSRPKQSRQVIETLERYGLLDFDMARQLRALNDVRNAIAHGDLAVEVDSGKSALLLRALRSVLTDLQAGLGEDVSPNGG